MSDIREDWAASVVGKALNPDRFAGNQCVDVTDHFGEFIFGVPWQQCVGGVRGAKDLLDRAPDEYWARIDYYHGFIPQRFDVLVYAGDSANEWGHTAIVESADKIGINVIQQDGFAAPHQFVDGNWYSAKPAHRARLAYSARGTGPLLGVLRPRPDKLKSSTIQFQSITTTQPIPEDDMSAEDVKAIRGDLNTVHEAVKASESRARADIATVHNTIIRDVGGQLAGLREAVRQVASGNGVTIDLVAIEAAAKRGAEDAIANGVVTVDVNVKGAAE